MSRRLGFTACRSHSSLGMNSRHDGRLAIQVTMGAPRSVGALIAVPIVLQRTKDHNAQMIASGTVGDSKSHAAMDADEQLRRSDPVKWTTPRVEV